MGEYYEVSEYTAEDFAQANLATKGEFGVARRTDPNLTRQWNAYDSGYGWFSDEEMAADGWEPVVESRVTELSLRDLEVAWENAEVPTSPDFRDEDVVIVRNDSGIGGYFVRHAHDTLDLELWAEGAVRYLYRAPREPWAGLADVLGDFAIHDHDGKEYPDVLAQRLYERGVRVTGGGDDE